MRRRALSVVMSPRVVTRRPLAGPAVRSLSSAPGGSSGASSSAEPEQSLTERAATAMGMAPSRVRAKAAEKLMTEASRGRGWREALEIGLVEQQRLKRSEAVQEQLERLANMETYGFDDFTDLVQASLKEIEEGTSGVATKARLFADRMSGGTQEQTIERQKEQQKRKLAILTELTVHEKRQPKLLDRKARRVIASKLGIDVVTIDELLFEFQLQRAQWSFIRREALRGRPLPSSADDLEWMMKTKPTREFVHVMSAYEQHRKKLEDARNVDRA